MFMKKVVKKKWIIQVQFFSHRKIFIPVCFKITLLFFTPFNHRIFLWSILIIDLNEVSQVTVQSLSTCHLGDPKMLSQKFKSNHCFKTQALIKNINQLNLKHYQYMLGAMRFVTEDYASLVAIHFQDYRHVFNMISSC